MATIVIRASYTPQRTVLGNTHPYVLYNAGIGNTCNLRECTVRILYCFCQIVYGVAITYSSTVQRHMLIIPAMSIARNGITCNVRHVSIPVAHKTRRKEVMKTSQRAHVPVSIHSIGAMQGVLTMIYDNGQ